LVQFQYFKATWAKAMTHNFRQSSSLSRSGFPIKQPKPKIVVVCEGKVTEPKYFEDFRLYCGNSLVTVKAIGGCGVPVSVVERAIAERERLVREAKASRDSFDQIFEVWAVFDRDAHPQPQVPTAIANAQINDIRVAFSNPCFEVWGLMHYSCYSRPGHHHETQRELKRILTGYCHERNPVMSLQLLQPKYETAVTNSQQALRRREQEDSPNGDPSTTVHLLTERIREFGKK
jgi:hypothetical protein